MVLRGVIERAFGNILCLRGFARLGEGISKGSIACFTQLVQHLPGQSRLFVFHEITILVSVFSVSTL